MCEIDSGLTVPPEGPWWLNPEYDGLKYAWTGSRTIVCADADTGGDAFVAHTTRGWPDGGLAIARLIAAAPELYEALRRLLTAIGPETHSIGAVHEARCALAKACGA